MENWLQKMLPQRERGPRRTGTSALSQVVKKMVRKSAGGRRWVPLHLGQSPLSDFSIPKVNMPIYPRNKNFHGTGVMEPSNYILLLRDFDKKKPSNIWIVWTSSLGA